MKIRSKWNNYKNKPREESQGFNQKRRLLMPAFF